MGKVEIVLCRIIINQYAANINSLVIYLYSIGGLLELAKAIAIDIVNDTAALRRHHWWWKFFHHELYGMSKPLYTKVIRGPVASSVHNKKETIFI